MDIKQRLQQAIEDHGVFRHREMEATELCRDALAEIERLEKALLKVEDDSRDRSAQLHALRSEVDKLKKSWPTEPGMPGHGGYR